MYLGGRGGGEWGAEGAGWVGVRGKNASYTLDFESKYYSQVMHVPFLFTSSVVERN